MSRTGFRGNGGERGRRQDVEYRAEPYRHGCPDEPIVLMSDTLTVRRKSGDFAWEDDRRGPGPDGGKIVLRMRDSVQDGVYVETPVFLEGMA